MKNIDPGPTLGLHEGFEVKKKIKTIKPKELQLRHYHVSKPPNFKKCLFWKVNCDPPEQCLGPKEEFKYHNN